VTAPELSAALDAAGGSRPIVLDLSELGFIDSGGVHAIIQRASSPEDIRLVCPEGNVARVLSIVRIDQVMPVYERLEDALADLAE
jgi:anti-sigma B factor antagonist